MEEEGEDDFAGVVNRESRCHLFFFTLSIKAYNMLFFQ